MPPVKGDPRVTPAREDLAADYLRAVVKVSHYVKGVPRQVRLQPLRRPVPGWLS